MLQGNSLLNTYRLLSNSTHAIMKEFIKQVALYDRYKFTYQCLLSAKMVI